VVLVGACFVPQASAQYSASGDVLFASKYVWRGYRVTDEPVIQPAMTLGIGGFAFNAWGNLDLTNINGQQGDFSEIDYTFSYDQAFEGGSVGGGVIFYAFPGAPTTTELYGGISFDVVGAPSVTLYVDVDETRAGGGDPGLYVLLGGGHSFPTNSDVVPSIDISGSFAFANDGFTGFYAGVGGGTHDASVGLSVPFVIDDNWSASGFVTYSGLVGDNLRVVFADPDTVVGGASINLSF
jgi:hypothetical protein